jgi:hypothetical protein
MLVDILGAIPAIKENRHLIGENIAVGEPNGLGSLAQVPVDQAGQPALMKTFQAKIKSAKGGNLFR